MSRNLLTVDGHVLIPHQADWLSVPGLERIWRGDVQRSLAGDEDRSSVRSEPWKKLSYSVLPFNHIESRRFDDRMREALRIGKIAVPHWGKGTGLGSDVEAENNTLVLARSSHGLSEGDYILVQSQISAEFDMWDCVQVLSVSQSNISFADVLSYSYTANVTRVWPLLFGKPIIDQFSIMNNARGRYSVTVQFDAREIAPVAYDNFQSYDLGEVTTPLNNGEGWIGPWVSGAFV